MYRHHQGAKLLESSLSGINEIGECEWIVPEITESVSKKDDIVTITLNNLSATDKKDLDISFVTGKEYEVVEANIVTSSDMHAHNTFDSPEVVKEITFKNYKTVKNGLKVTIPACSVVEIRVR